MKTFLIITVNYITRNSNGPQTLRFFNFTKQYFVFKTQKAASLANHSCPSELSIHFLNTELYSNEKQPGYLG
jgi:hypothetical protein